MIINIISFRVMRMLLEIYVRDSSHSFGMICAGVFSCPVIPGHDPESSQLMNRLRRYFIQLDPRFHGDDKSLYSARILDILGIRFPASPVTAWLFRPEGEEDGFRHSMTNRYLNPVKNR